MAIPAFHTHPALGEEPNLRPRSFAVGDLVLCLKQDEHEKLESPWTGTYIVTEVIPGGAYRLKDKETGKEEGNPWNVAQLRRFYT